jgi:hypothetical protein
LAVWTLAQQRDDGEMVAVLDDARRGDDHARRRRSKVHHGQRGWRNLGKGRRGHKRQQAGNDRTG